MKQHHKMTIIAHNGHPFTNNENATLLFIVPLHTTIITFLATGCAKVRVKRY